MTDKRPLDDTELDGLFAATRAAPPVPPGDMMARIAAAAEAHVAVPVPALQPRRGLVAAILSAIGGWQAAVGLATAAFTGLAIGLASPDTLEALSGGYLVSAGSSYQLEDLLPSYGDLLGEG